MRKMICLLALFLFAFSGCSEEESAEKMVEAESEIKDVVIFTDNGEKTKEAAEEICGMIDAQVVDYKKLEEKDLNQLVETKELVLLGAQEENQEFFDDMDSILKLEHMKEKRVSLFFVGEEKGLLSWEKRVKKQEQIRLTPTFCMTGEKDQKTEEKNRMMGWLTTAFTY